MAIPKRYKKQVKSALSGKTTQKVQKDMASQLTKPKSKRIWALKVGDLVEDEAGECAIIIGTNDQGFYQCLSTTGSTWKKATKIAIVQKYEEKKENPDE